MQIWNDDGYRWIKNDVIDRYLSFIPNLKQYENANNGNLVYFEKPLWGCMYILSMKKQPVMNA